MMWMYWILGGFALVAVLFVGILIGVAVASPRWPE